MKCVVTTMSDLVVEIAVGISANKTFHYRVPDSFSKQIVAGSRVLVPFGSRRIHGTVLGFPLQEENAGLKSVIEIIGAPLPKDLLALACWMSDYYLHPLGQTIEAVVSKAITRSKQKKKKYMRLLQHPASSLRGGKQRALIEVLARQNEVDCNDLTGFSSTTIHTLVEAGFVEIIEREEPDILADAFIPSNSPTLMPAQVEAIQKISKAISLDIFGVFLLHGVTGSGKTEVYLHAIAKLIGSGRGAIVLVPEIALTPQLLGRFKQRFGDRVAVLHSGLTDRERADEYRRIIAGRVDVAIGARSAVFAPFENLGILIVDEEHENSYKQEEGLRYHARDVAVMRAKLQNAVAVLGSATPSLESYYNAKNGKYDYLRLPDRVDHRPMPEVSIIDSRKFSSLSLYSPALIENIRQRIARNEQSLLLLNRRGFSSVLICSECGIAIKCPSCSVSLTYHKTEQRLKCHYCGYYIRPPDECPACLSTKLKLLGSGTQKIEEELRTIFPIARLRRMDSDTVKGRNASNNSSGS